VESSGAGALMPITPKDRSALLRMAGNIAAGLVGTKNSFTIFDDDTRHAWVADEAVSITLKIHADPRLAVEEAKE
jgi:hypothetical protein